MKNISHLLLPFLTCCVLFAEESRLELMAPRVLNGVRCDIARSWNDLSVLQEGRSGNISYSFEAGLAQEGLRFQVVVTDPEQKNDQQGRMLFRGDAVYFGLDGLANTAQDSLRDQNDCVIIAAIGAAGPEVRVLRHGDSTLLGSAPQLLDSIIRNEEQQTTTYRLLVPWSFVHVGYGQSEQFGVSLVVAHKNEEKKDQQWGELGIGRKKQPVYNVVSCDWPDADVLSCGSVSHILLHDSVGVQLALTHKGAADKIRVQFGKEEWMYKVPASNGLLNRYRLQLPADRLDATGQVQVFSADKRLASYTVRSPAVLMAQIEERVAQLTQQCTNELLKNHLRSVEILVRHQYTMLQYSTDEDASHFQTAVQYLLDSLPLAQFNEDAYFKQCLPFVKSFQSEADRSLQFYYVQLPYGWEEGKEYPLLVYLHGALTHDHPLIGLVDALDNSHQDTLFRYQDIDPENIPPSHQCIVVVPWARGNAGYERLAERDVLQSVKMIEEQFTINEERRYIAGFSMGCNGAWKMAARFPDFWAGVGLSAGTGLWSSVHRPDYLQNCKHLPVSVWVGEKDGAGGESGSQFLYAKRFVRDLQAAGVKHRFITVPDLGHTYPYDEFQKDVAWLLQHERQRPDQFNFECFYGGDDQCFGVRLSYEGMTKQKCSKVRCTIVEQDVYLDTENVVGLAVDLGPDGLDMQGEVTVHWNGASVYTGGVDILTLGKGLSRWQKD